MADQSNQTQKPADIEYARLDDAARARLRRRTIALAALLIVVFVLGVLAWHLINRAFGATTITTSTSAFVSSIRSEAKYVVASQTLTVTVERAETYQGWWGIYLGTTTARVRVDDCRVQYVLPSDQISMDDFVFDRSRNTLTVTLPRPRLDLDIVDIPTDPAKWWKQSSSGWARFNKADVLQEAQKAVRTQTLVAANRQGFDEATEAVAAKRLRESLRKFLKQPDLLIEVVFRPQPASSPAQP